LIVIPAIDLLGGKAVRLHQGRYDQVTVYDDEPAARAQRWRGVASRLHVVDLEGAKAGHAVQREGVAKVIAAFGPGVQVGGGVRTREAFESYRALGADRIVLGSAAVREPELVTSLAREHPGVVILAVDASDGLVVIEGWTRASAVTALELARSFAKVPLAAILYTDVARDGTRSGPNVDATAELAEGTGLPVIASGGVGTLDDLRTLAARGVFACIVGRALYENRFTMEQANLAASGAPR
jgi:phosphoribosylformimino-5-aminoimidazole carboxamide ribotide isomerase